MNPLAVATMAVVCGFVWGGFLGLLTYALRQEGAKGRPEDSGPETA